MHVTVDGTDHDVLKANRRTKTEIEKKLEEHKKALKEEGEEKH